MSDEYTFAILHNDNIYRYSVDGVNYYTAKTLIRHIESFSIKGKGILVNKVNPFTLDTNYLHVVRFSVTDGMIFEVLDWDVFKREWAEWLKALEEPKTNKDKLPYEYPWV